jgi:hypothetical protein
MKILKFFFTILFLLLINLNNVLGQLSTALDPGRGIYVNNFFSWVNGSVHQDPNYTILGYPAKEQELLDFCDKYHITHIILYDINDVIQTSDAVPTYTYNGKTIKQHFCDFMLEAKNNHCISKIGVAGGSQDFFDDLYPINPTPAVVLNPAVKAQIQFDTDLVETNISPNSPNFRMSEYLKFFIRSTGMEAFPITCAADYVDVFVTEYEWWFTHTDYTAPCDEPLPQVKWPIFKQLLEYVDQLRYAYNTSGTHTNTLYIESYISVLDNFDAATYTYDSNQGKCIPSTTVNPNNNHQEIADFIDGYDDVNHLHRSDRILSASYTKDPRDLYNAYRVTDYYTERILDLGEIGFSPTEQDNRFSNTDYHPIFSAEATHMGSGADFFGQWFIEPVLTPAIPVINRNMFTAEKIYYDDYYFDTNILSQDNTIEPGGFQWFTSSHMLHPLNNQKIFVSNNPICNNGTGSGIANFTYQGPIDPQIAWVFKIDGATVQSATTTNYIPGGSPNPTNPAIYHPYIIINPETLTVGQHSATMEITYPNGCSYSYTEQIMVVSTPTIIALGPTNLCRAAGIGDYVVLQAPSGGTSYQWYNNNSLMTGATNNFLQVTVAGNYHCVITGGGCAGISTPILVTVTNIPSTSINVQFIGSNCTAELSITNVSGNTYLWANGSTTNSMQTGNSGVYTVMVTNNGCSSTGSYNYQKFTVDPVLVQPCFGQSDGSILLDINLGNPATSGHTYSWNTGSTSNPLLNVSASSTPYSYTVLDANGCSRAGTVTVNSLPDINVTFNVTPSTCQNSTDGAVDATISGGQNPYSFLWTPSSQTTEDLNAVPSDLYNLHVIDFNGCEYDRAVNVPFTNTTISQSVQIIANPAGQICQGDQVTFTAIPQGTIATPDYEWHVGTTIVGSNSITYSTSGLQNNDVVYVVMSSQDLCPAQNPMTSNNITVSISPTVMPTCTLAATPNPVFTGQITTFSWTYTNGGITPTFDLYWVESSSTTEHLLATNINSPYNYVPSTIVGYGNGDYFIIKMHSAADCPVQTDVNSNGELITIVVPSGCTTSSMGVSSITYATCPTFTNGSVTIIDPSSYTTFGINLYKHDGTNWNFISTANGTSPYTFSNLTAGVYQARSLNMSGTEYMIGECNPVINHILDVLFSITAVNNGPHPQIQSNFSQLCCGTLISTGNFTTYGWLLNNTSLNVTTQSLNTTSHGSGSYTVNVTDATGCLGSSSIIINHTINSTITGGSTTCSSNFTVPINPNNAIYQWTVPLGASFTQNGNAIHINWGTAYNTGGIISCTIINGCGLSSTGTLSISSCCNISISATVQHTCNGLNNGRITAHPSSSAVPLLYTWAPNVGNSQIVSGLPAGGYTVTITNALGCTASTSVLVHPSTPIQATVVTSPACESSENGSALVSTVSGGISPYAYLWDQGSSGISISNLHSGIYTVIITDQNACTSIGSAIVGSVPFNLNAPIIGGSSSACIVDGPSLLYSASNWDSNLDDLYSWNITPFSSNPILSYPNSNNSVAEISWINNSGGMIILNLGVTGCMVSDTLYVQNCCVSDKTYYDGQTVDAITTDNYITQSNMTFNGQFIIDRDFSFLNCGEILFSAGAEMIVNAGVELTLEGCTLTASGDCCEMWKGIYLESNSKITTNYVTISQAERGLTINDKTVFSINNSHFINNYIGLQIGTDGPTDITGSKMYNTDFSSSPYDCGGNTYTNFVPPYNGQSTILGVYPLSGIVTNQVSFFKIGNLPNILGGDIRFENLSNGIISNNSNLMIQNSKFVNMVADAAYFPLQNFLNGCGIHANNSVVNQHGFGGQNTSELSFDNCNYGIVLLQSEGSLSDNNGLNLENGIRVHESTEVDIIKNTFQCNKNGIILYNNPNGIINIDDNEVNMSTTYYGNGCLGIYDFDIPNQIVVKNNYFYLNKSVFGISTYGMQNAEIKSNYIAMNDQSNYAGIEINLGKNNILKCNTVQASSTNSGEQVGIAVNLSPENQFSCNWVDKQFYGFRFNGPCSNTTLEGNLINDHNFGLSLFYNGLIGVQSHAGNQWLGSYISYGAYLSGITSLSAQANQFFYDVNGSFNSTSTNDIYNYDWFKDGLSADFKCDNFDCQPMVPMNPLVNSEDELIASENNIGSEYISPTNYFADKYLFEKLKNNPDLLNNNSILEAFYYQTAYGNIGYYTDLAVDIKQVAKWESVYEIVLSNNLNDIEIQMDSAYYLDSLLSLTPTDQNLIAALTSANTTIRLLQSSNNAIKKIISEINELRKNNALDDNNSIAPSEIYEQNESIINNIYLNTLSSQNYSFNSDEEINLISIAQQCPFSGGPSVYRARALYKLIDDEIVWNDDLICSLNGNVPRVKDEGDNYYKLFPNPAYNEITMSYSLKEDDNAQLMIVNSLGEKIKMVVLPSSQNFLTVSIDKLRPGIYYFQVVKNSSIDYSTKVAIIK